MKRIVSGVVATLLLVSMLTFAFNIQPVKGEWTGTVYILADGSIDPPDAPITTVDGIAYTLTDNIISPYHGIVVYRSNIVIDGNGHALRGSGIGYGLHLSGVNNVTLKNTNIEGFSQGILFDSASYNLIYKNKITNCRWGVRNFAGSNNDILENQIVNSSVVGICLDSKVSKIKVSGNNITASSEAIRIYSYSNEISGNKITSNEDGVVLIGGSDNIIWGNDIIANSLRGIALFSSSNNKILKNNITANGFYGIYVGNSSNNLFYHNNIMSNAIQVYNDYVPGSFPRSINVWDDGYPSGGNYWSDYAGVDYYSGPDQDQPGSDGIGDTPYVIDENNIDRYPLMKPCGMKIIYVPDDYEKIQAAVNAANVGDIIIVRAGTYSENVKVNKDHLTIKSESGAAMTIVQAADSDDYIFDVIADYVIIDGFTIKSSAGATVHLNEARYCTISNNHILNDAFGYGVALDYADGNILVSNIIEGNMHGGIALVCSHHNKILNNLIQLNRGPFGIFGIYLGYCRAGFSGYPTDSASYNIVTDNTIVNCSEGIYMVGSQFNKISGNIIEGNNHGLYITNIWNWFIPSKGNNFTNNIIKLNTYGMVIYYSNDNIIYLNNFINNEDNAYSYASTDIWNSPQEITYIYKGRAFANYIGNYWSDYTGSDADGDGIGDTPYVIDVDNSDNDNYPLIEPFENYFILPALQWSFDADFQYNLDSNYATVEGAGHLSGSATLSDGTFSIQGQVTLNGPLPSAIPEVYLIATDGQDKELSKKLVDFTYFSYWQTGPNTYGFSGTVPDAPQPINNGHYEISALITYNSQQYQFFINTNSQINSHYFPLWTPTIPPKFKIGDWVQTTARLNVRGGPGLGYAIISTVPEGTLGQIVGGPVEADNYVWWNVNYLLDYVEWIGGWSAENWLELYPLPICTVKLQRDGVEINEIAIWELFDIYVGDSTGVNPIKTVRFSSDDVQDGIPTGEWTEWYPWSLSLEDWDATTKIKRWAFATPGHKEVWAEVMDEAGYVAAGSANIFAPTSALPVITSPLVITPIKDIYNVGDILEAEFTIKNIGNVPITLDVLTVGGRLNGFIPPEGAPDFMHRSVSLQPNESYQYQGSLTLNQTGNYHFFVAYHIENPTPGEMKLLDENNWNTCVDLGEGLTHSDRVKNIIVYEEGVVPGEVSELYETINRWMNRKTQYPAYLIDPDQGSWAASVWVTISSVWTHIQETYDELWNAGVDHDCLSRMEAIYARRFLDKGDIDSAKKHLQSSYLQDKISNMYFGAAAEVFDANIKRGEEIVKNTLKFIELGVAVYNPIAGKFASYMFMVPNYIADVDLVGVEQAQKNAVRDLIFKVIFSEYKNPELGGRTFENYFNNRIGKITFPYLQKMFENNEVLQFYLSKVLKEAAAEGMEWLYDKAESLSEKIVDELSKRFEAYIYKKFSPIELRVFNPREGMTGQINGSIRHDISRSFYRNGTITIFFPSDSYVCEVAGKDEGTYGLEISLVEAWNTTVFIATDIPALPNAIHQYSIDWTALSQGEEGVTVMVDSDGDGVFEYTFTSDSELTQNEYLFATDNTPPTTTLEIGEPKYVDATGNVYVSSATPFTLTAEDNPGGTGVASTFYRIYNSTYETGWIEYSEPFYLTGLSDGEYSIDYYSVDNLGNTEPANTATVILDNTSPKTTLNIGEPKYETDITYVTPETPFTLEAYDNIGSGIYSITYRIYNSTYDSGWLPYTEPFYLTGLADGTYTIEFYSIDNLGNTEPTNSIQVTLFSWNYIFEDTYGRGTTLKINTEYTLFQLITPDKDYGIRNATYMRVYKRAIILYHRDNELKLAAISIDTQLDFCIAYAKDIQTGKEYWLMDKVGTEN